MTARLIGAFLLSVGGAGLGWTAGERLRARANLLTELHAGIEALRREIGFYQRSVPEALECAAASVHGTVSWLFLSCAEQLYRGDGTPFASAWDREIKSKLTALSREEKAILLQLGNTLGRFDAEIQCHALDQCAARLEETRRSAREAWQRQKRLYLALGGGMGAALALLLL